MHVSRSEARQAHDAAPKRKRAWRIASKFEAELNRAGQVRSGRGGEEGAVQGREGAEQTRSEGWSHSASLGATINAESQVVARQRQPCCLLRSIAW